mmetsp:Transcript_25991/g.72588  ORF Transcript_25991/g.72588 Transcript_25991/m.72588 type:complete len:245 (-) Transcript_25991:1079-1813(-)
MRVPTSTDDGAEAVPSISGGRVAAMSVRVGRPDGVVALLLPAQPRFIVNGLKAARLCRPTSSDLYGRSDALESKSASVSCRLFSSRPAGVVAHGGPDGLPPVASASRPAAPASATPAAAAGAPTAWPCVAAASMPSAPALAAPTTTASAPSNPSVPTALLGDRPRSRCKDPCLPLRSPPWSCPVKPVPSARDDVAGMYPMELRTAACTVPLHLLRRGSPSSNASTTRAVTFSRTTANADSTARP